MKESIRRRIERSRIRRPKRVGESSKSRHFVRIHCGERKRRRGRRGTRRRRSRK